MATATRRIKYDRGSINSTIGAAVRLNAVDGLARYVFATAYGFTIDETAPPFTQDHFVIRDGKPTLVAR